MDRGVFARVDAMLYAAEGAVRCAPRYGVRAGRDPTPEDALRNLEARVCPDVPEGWLKVAAAVRAHFAGSRVGEVYVRRYVRRQGFRRVCRELFLSRNACFSARMVFFLSSSCFLGIFVKNRCYTG